MVVVVGPESVAGWIKGWLNQRLAADRAHTERRVAAASAAVAARLHWFARLVGAYVPERGRCGAEEAGDLKGGV